MHPFSHLTRISYDAETHEPFIPLPAPLSAYRMCPWRSVEDEADVEAMVALLNDERVIKTLSGPPNPFEREHAQFWIGRRDEDTKKLVEFLRTNTLDGCRRISGSAFEVIRYSADPDRAGGKLLGVVSLELEKHDLPMAKGWPEPFFPSLDFARDQEWCFGDYLSPDHHNKGIMTQCIKTLFEAYLIPLMDVRLFRLNVHEGNWASRRVFEKNGFEVVGRSKRRGEDDGWHWNMEWRRD
ncbi:hypothetical protein BT69DRAFT_1349870 [Atractiella rhizophila]|nr:hypothetical protein BT69DRAFT_1349870 [Atractiella rhizophila]